ncbi:translation initiation factor eIF-2B subunit epsilon isoform X1 [Cephus cinctus]|uniref:Translation initiation factor eIF2B subunit epsilon n=1 Tax=Cephus cinctus TaxID=211228 RepID=A0AAJ7BS18_CEPCN|nr:translation initiation factor eIF-2B subunit epsilon isoform X1 [Cephus cinctus]
MSKITKKDVNSKLGKKDVLQAVVLADDFTTNLTPVQNVYPSILMPVVNVPLLDYLIETLVQSRIQELYLYCSSHIESLKKYVQSKNSDDISINLIISDGCRSLGDALRDIDTKGAIRGDFILIRGDAFTNANLKNLLELHRVRIEKDKGAAMTLLLRDVGSTNIPSLIEESSLVVADGSNNKVLFYKKLAKDEKKVKLELEWFLDHDKIEINTGLLDTHIYLCSPAVPPLFSDNFDFQTMEDFIRGVLMNEEILDSRIYWQRLDSEEYALPVTSWRAYHMLSREILQRHSYPLTPDTLSFVRNFTYLSRSTYRHRNAVLARGCVIQRDSIVGPNSMLGKDTFITRSTIGNNCIVGANVQIENSYILSNVFITDNCMIKNSIIFSNCQLDKKVNLDACILSPSVHLKSNSSYVDSVLEYESGKLNVTKISELNLDTDKELLYFTCKESKDGKDCDGYSTDSEDSSSEDDSAPASPLPDDTNMFLSEVIDSLLRGYQDGLNCENLILEINSSRYAYNVSIREVSYNVIKAILSLPLHYLSDQKSPINQANYQSTLKKMISYFFTIIQNYIKTEDAQDDCLKAMEEAATTIQELLSFMQRLLHLFYERDILSEEKILEWYELNGDNENEVQSLEIKKAVGPFIKWLKEAEEDSSDNEED